MAKAVFLQGKRHVGERMVEQRVDRGREQARERQVHALDRVRQVDIRARLASQGLDLRPAGVLEPRPPRANASSKFPRAMSSVSPNTWYRPQSNADTIVFPPLTYQRERVVDLACQPADLHVRDAMVDANDWHAQKRRECPATLAPTRRHGPRPGPCEKATKSIASSVVPA